MSSSSSSYKPRINVSSPNVRFDETQHRLNVDYDYASTSVRKDDAGSITVSVTPARANTAQLITPTPPPLPP